MKTVISLLTLIPSMFCKTFTTNKLFNHYIRPKWAGDITITYNEHIESIEGIIIPISTSGRHNAPSPFNKDCKTGYIYNLDRGHIMALSNGGPDISENIVPQYNTWQRPGGEWYKLEREIHNLVSKEYEWNNIIHPGNELEKYEPLNKAYWKINLLYKDVCSIGDNECNCQPYKYDGYVKTKDVKYNFEIINNGEYTFELEIAEIENHNYVIIYVLLIIITFIIISVFYYKRNKNYVILKELEYNNDLELGEKN